VGRASRLAADRANGRCTSRRVGTRRSCTASCSLGSTIRPREHQRLADTVWVSTRSTVGPGLATCLVAAGCGGTDPHRPTAPPPTHRWCATTAPARQVHGDAGVDTKPDCRLVRGARPRLARRRATPSRSTAGPRGLTGRWTRTARGRPAPAGTAIPLDLAGAAPQALVPFLPAADQGRLRRWAAARHSPGGASAWPPLGGPPQAVPGVAVVIVRGRWMAAPCCWRLRGHLDAALPLAHANRVDRQVEQAVHAVPAARWVHCDLHAA
jgi:hypothetical protein